MADIDETPPQPKATHNAILRFTAYSPADEKEMLTTSTAGYHFIIQESTGLNVCFEVAPHNKESENRVSSTAVY
jgi:hypothetical protein